MHMAPGAGGGRASGIRAGGSTVFPLMPGQTGCPKSANLLGDRVSYPLLAKENRYMPPRIRPESQSHPHLHLHLHIIPFSSETHLACLALPQTPSFNNSLPAAPALVYSAPVTKMCYGTTCSSCCKFKPLCRALRAARHPQSLYPELVPAHQETL